MSTPSLDADRLVGQACETTGRSSPISSQSRQISAIRQDR